MENPARQNGVHELLPQQVTVAEHTAWTNIIWKRKKTEALVFLADWLCMCASDIREIRWYPVAISGQWAVPSYSNRITTPSESSRRSSISCDHLHAQQTFIILPAHICLFLVNIPLFTELHFNFLSKLGCFPLHPECISTRNSDSFFLGISIAEKKPICKSSNKCLNSKQLFCHACNQSNQITPSAQCNYLREG